MNIDEIIELLWEVRIILTALKEYVNDKEIKEQLKWIISGIEVVVCELTQTISKILKDKK
jgi:hypothetical protein